MPTATAEIVNFLDQNTGLFATASQISDALTTGQYGGLTPLDADGKAVPPPPSSTISPVLIAAADTQQIRGSQVPTQAGAPNYLLWAAIAFGIWYFLLRKK
jgi:hypothetical protein